MAQLWGGLLQAAPDAVVVTADDGRILFVNAPAERLLGYPAAELVGQPVEILVPEPARVEHPDQRAGHLAGSHPRPPGRMGPAVRRRDGSEFVAEISLSPVANEHGRFVVAVLRDVSRWQRATHAEALLEAVPDALLAIDPDGVVVGANGAAARAFGYPRTELIGQPVKLLLPEGPFGGSGPPVPGAGEASRLARHRDGVTFPIDVTAAVLDGEDPPVTGLVIRDSSQRLHAEAERVRLGEEVERQRHAAQLHRINRLDSLSLLAGRIAHDFNNLLGVIGNYAAFVVDEAGASPPDSAAIAADAEHIVRAGQRGSELTRQLLSFARRVPTQPHPLDLNRSIADTAEAVRQAIGDQIKLDTVLAADLPLVVADPAQLAQVLLHLANNARDAMPTGGHLTIDTGVVMIEAQYAAARPDLVPGPYVRLRVGDCGAGMSPEVRARAFEPFYTTKTSGQGSGLGLALVYDTVAQAGGTVTLHSQSDFGTTVNVLLPAEAQPGQPPSAAPTGTMPGQPSEPGFGRGQGVFPPVSTGTLGDTVLVAVEDPAVGQAIVRMLSAAGYPARSAPDVAAALAVAGNDRQIGVLISDLAMAWTPGAELAQRLVAKRPDTRILYLSGHAPPVLEAGRLLDSRLSVLGDPFTQAELLHAVRGLGHA